MAMQITCKLTGQKHKITAKNKYIHTNTRLRSIDFGCQTVSPIDLHTFLHTVNIKARYLLPR